MSKQLFISYSHKDETYREDFEEHLAILKRNGHVSVWHDRKILPSDEWRNCIDENLDGSDIIILLVSSSFISSDYCYDVELKRAIERHEAGTAKIIAIILRDCDWKGAPFAKYQALPKDARPISQWADKDSAWLDVITGLKKVLEEPIRVDQLLSVIDVSQDVKITAEIETWLDDTEIVLTHRKVDVVKLSDVYVSLELEFDNDKKKENDFVSSDILYREKGFYLLSGEEQQGKTSLLKNLYKQFLKTGCLPLYVNASEVNNANLSQIIETITLKQYIGLSSSSYSKASNKVLLVDNFDEIRLNSKFKNQFLLQASSIFEWVIITCHSSFNYVSAELPSLSLFSEYRLLGFGNAKREEVVKKWVSLGVEEVIEEHDLYNKCDEIKDQLNTVIKKNIVPSKPIYVLMLLQMFEAYAQQNLELTSYGHCYQQLIYQSFEKARIRGSDIGKYLNVLTELSWEMYLLSGGINKHQLDVFFSKYGQKYLPVDSNEILTKTIQHAILVERDGITSFKYPYIFYFFVAKKIAEGFSESNEIKGEVHNLLSKLHREDYANILIFITHHTKDSWVLNEIMQVLSSLFADQNKATLTKSQLAFMDDFVKTIPDLVIEQREVQQERDNHNRRLDEIERSNDEEEVEEEEESLDRLATINKAFKGMEIAGQIIRNRHSTLTRDALYNLAESGTFTGLRFLDYFIKISDTAKSEIINHIAKKLSEYPNLTNRELQDYAEDVYLHMTYGVINGVIRKISSSIGSKEAEAIYKALEDSEKTPAFTLIRQAISLHFTRELNFSSIEATFRSLEGNPVCLRILKEIVVQHIYMFPVSFKDKQKLSSLLKLSVKGQHIMDMKKQIKG